MITLVLLLAGGLLVLQLLALGLVLSRLHEVEETVALHELALSHLTQPGGVADHVHPGMGSPVRLLPPGA